MPDPIESFRNAFDYYDTKDAIFESKEGSSVIKYFRKLGYDILDSGKDWFENTFKNKTQSDMNSSDKNIQKPLPPKPLINNIQEEAVFGSNTPLQEVTKPKLKEYTTPNMSFSVRDLHGIFKFKKGESQYLIGAGDKFSVGYRNNTYRAEVKHNLFNGKSELNGSINSRFDSKYASVYHYKDGNYGATIGYSNRKGFSTSISTDKHGNSALSLGYYHRTSDAEIDVKGFVSTYNKSLSNYYEDKDCRFGVVVRIWGL